MTLNAITFREYWNSRHFDPTLPDKKARLKAADALLKTMRYYNVVGKNGKLTDVFVKSQVIPLLPDPNIMEQWQEQWQNPEMMNVVRRILCDVNGHYDQPATLSAVASASIFANTRDEFLFMSGQYKGAYPSEIKNVLNHLWKYRVAIKEQENGDKPSAKQFNRMLKWMYHTLRPHHQNFMMFFNQQVLYPSG
jgi:hypothetical protein